MGDVKNLIFVFDRMPDQDGCNFIEVENEAGELLCAGEWRTREDGLAELVVPVNYDALAREAELREELADEKTGAAGIYQQLEICRKQLESAKEELEGTKYMRRKFRQDRDDLQQRLTAAEQRNATLEAELEVEKINAAHWKSTIAGEGQISKEARRYRGIRDILPLNELIEATADCQSSAEWDNAVDAALKPTESGASE